MHVCIHTCICMTMNAFINECMSRSQYGLVFLYVCLEIMLGLHTSVKRFLCLGLLL